MIHQIIFFKVVSSVFQHYNLGVGKKSWLLTYFGDVVHLINESYPIIPIKVPPIGDCGVKKHRI